MDKNCKQISKMVIDVVQDATTFACVRSINPKVCLTAAILGSNIGQKVLDTGTDYICKLATQEPKISRK